MSCSECSKGVRTAYRQPMAMPAPCPCQNKQPQTAPAQAYVPETCGCNFTITEMATKRGNYLFNVEGCMATLNIKDGVKANETITQMTNDGNGNIVYKNEKGQDQMVNIRQLLPSGNIEDLGNVEDELGDGCAFLFKPKGSTQWQSWKTDKYKLQADEKARGVMVFTEGGCPRFLEAPATGLSTLVAKDGKVQWTNIQLPDGANKDEFNPAWGNINETHAKQENGNWVPDRQSGIFTHNPNVDKCHDIIVG